VVLPDNCRSGAYHAFGKNRLDAVLNGDVSIDRNRAIKDAKQEWEDTKAFYAARVAEKIEIYLQGDVEIDLDLTSHGILEGSCTANQGDKQLVLGTALKINYRYGENSANGHLTIYRQVPTVISSAKGFDPVAVLADAMAKDQQNKADRKAALKTAQEALCAAEKRKRLIDDLHGLNRWEQETRIPLTNGNLDDRNKLVVQLGLTDAPDFATTKAMVLSARNTVKELKAALRTIRETK
jgi:hypothetical protein